MKTIRSAILATLGLVCFYGSPTRAHDIAEITVERVEYFTQCTTNRADTTMDRQHQVICAVYPGYSGAIASATASLPSKVSAPLSDNGTALERVGSFGAPAPAGTYHFHIETADEGVKGFNLALPGPANGIRPLRIANFLEAQAVDANQDFTVQWDTIPNYGAHDYLVFYIRDTNNATVYVTQKMPLSQTSLAIPAGTLQPHQTYRAYLYLRHYFALKNRQYPVLALRELRLTYFALKTINPSGVFRFRSTPTVAGEQDGVANVVVERLQGSSGDVTVDYFSNDTSAHAGANYEAVSGTLNFPDGVTNQTITIPLIEDGKASSPLSFRLSLTNATGGAGIQVRPHTYVTVLDSSSAPGTNTLAYYLARVRYYDQTSTNAPNQSNRCIAARFYAVIKPTFRGAITSSKMRLPNRTTIQLPYNGNGVGADFDFPSTLTRNSAFPAGVYQLTFNTLNDGAFSTTLSAGAERTFTIPHVSNWQELQSIDASQPVMIRWDPFTGATTNDYVKFSLRDPSNEYVCETHGEFEEGALPGTARSVTIPAGVLQPGTRYLANLIFTKMIEGKPFHTIRNGVASVHTTSFYVLTASTAQAGELLTASGDDDCPTCGKAETFRAAPADMDRLPTLETWFDAPPESLNNQ